jgi:hypothetical protein
MHLRDDAICGNSLAVMLALSIDPVDLVAMTSGGIESLMDSPFDGRPRTGIDALRQTHASQPCGNPGQLLSDWEEATTN